MRRKEIGKKMLIWTLSASMLAAPVLSSVSVYAEEYNVDQSNLNDNAKGAVATATDAAQSAEGAEAAGGTAATEADEAKKAAEIAEALAEKAILIYNEEEGKKVDVAGGAVTEAAGKVTTAQNAANQDKTDTETAASKAQNDAVGIVKKADEAMAAVYEDLGNKTIDKALTDAETAFGNATGDITDGKTTAEGKLTEIEDAIAAGTTDKRGMQALAGEADAAAQKAEGALTDAQDAVKATKDAYDKTLKIADDAQKELDKLLKDYETLAGQKDGDIETQKKAAKDAIEAAQGVLDKAEEDLKKAKDAYDASMKGLETATKDAEDAKNAAQIAASKADKAIDDLAILTSGRDYQTLVKERTAANDELSSAITNQGNVDEAQNLIIKTANEEKERQNGIIRTANSNIETLNGEINEIKNSDAYKAYENTIGDGDTYQLSVNNILAKKIDDKREVAGKKAGDPIKVKIRDWTVTIGRYTQSDIDEAKAYVQAYDAAVAAKAVLDGQISAKNTEISSNQTTINKANQAIAYQNNTVIAGANAAKKAAADNVTEKRNAYNELTDLVKGVDDCFFTADETFTYELTVEEQAAFKQYIGKAAESTSDFNTVNSDATKYKNATEDESFINLLKDYRNALKDTNLVDFVVRTLALKDSIDKAYERFEIVGDYHEYISLDGAYYTFDVVNGDKENISYFVALTSDKCIVKTINDTQKAVYAATFADEKAKKAESAAAQAKLDEAAALAKYTAALKAVEDAKEALKKIKFQDVTVEKKIELKATLANAKSVCSQAKEKYETSAKTAEELEETAGAARKAADKAKELADAIIVPAVANGTSAAPSFDEDDDVVLVGGRTVTNPQGTTNNGGGAVVTSSVRQGIAAGVANAANTANGGVALADNQIPLADGNAILGNNANKMNNNKKELKKLSPNDVPLAANVDFEDEQFSLVWLLAALAAAALIGFGTYKYQMSRKESAK